MRYPCLPNYSRKKTNNKSFFYGIDECLLLKFLKVSSIRHFLTWNKTSNFSFMFSNLLHFELFYNKKLSISLYFIDSFIFFLTYECLLLNSTIIFFLKFSRFFVVLGSFFLVKFMVFSFLIFQFMI